MWRESLKRMKAESGLTTLEIAEGSGIPEPTLEKLFAGVTKDPKLPTMKKLVHFFGYTLDDLYGEKEKSPAPSEDSAGENGKLGRDDVVKVLTALGFIDEGEKLADSDLLFLEGVINILDAWFEQRRQGV